jgi:Flp pilus assembly protein TadG
MARIAERRLRRGLALVEAALVLPLLLLLLLGLMEYGWIFLRTQQITHAARHGARIGATVDATNDDVINAIDAWMQQIGIEDYTVDISPDVSGLDKGEMLTVTVTGNDIRLWEASLVPTPSSFTAHVTMAKEGT